MYIHVAGISLLFVFAQSVHPRIRQDCECGVGNEEEIDLRIINGLNAFPHQYPWIVYMKYMNNAYCGGAIINDRYILTAGHCLYDLDPSKIVVVVGGNDAEVQDGISLAVDTYKLHENYTRYDSYDDNDIGLIRLKSKLHFNHKVRPICLPNPDSKYARATVVIAGWGITEHKKMSRYLLHNNVKVLSQEECMRAHRIGPKFVPAENLCAYGYNTDTCQGDSGSPLVYESSPYKFEIVGVVSWGEGCLPKKIPSVYAKVTHYVPWIDSNTNDASYCQAY